MRWRAIARHISQKATRWAIWNSPICRSRRSARRPHSYAAPSTSPCRTASSRTAFSRWCSAGFPRAGALFTTTPARRSEMPRRTKGLFAAQTKPGLGNHDGVAGIVRVVFDGGGQAKAAGVQIHILAQVGDFLRSLIRDSGHIVLVNDELRGPYG